MSSYDSTNIRVTDLKEGFIFEYDLQNWKVKAEYEYDWGNDFYTKEFKVSDGRNDYFLEIEEDDGIELAWSNKINLHAINVNLATEIIRNDAPPRTINFKGVSYHRVEESIGYFRNVRESNWDKFVSWDYENAEGNLYLTIERWGEEEFEASTGKKIREFEISNILPREEQAKRAPRDVDERKTAKNYAWLFGLGAVLLLFGFMKCSSSGDSKAASIRNPVEVLIEKHSNEPVFSIVLHDMNSNETGWKKEYFHKFMVLLEKDEVPYAVYTDWMPTSKTHFAKHQNDLGMELAAKTSGSEVIRTVSPPGYNQYVGNEKYGEWKQNEKGESFWSFYGKYMFMSSILNLGMRPIYQPYYSDYRNNYMRQNRAYYGPSTGQGNYYGTNSSYTKQARPDFFERKQQQQNKFNSSRSKTTRSSNRYNGSSGRSRGGGFGK